ncbi:MAG: SDH family Clp fold serine proteinase [Terriglobia bacterium]
METPIIAQVQSEQGQGQPTRKNLFLRLEKELQRPVISYYTSLVHQKVSIEDSDADILDSVLRHVDLSKGFALLISSNGGYGEAAERIVNVCRNASGTGEFWTIVPGKAKSAATVICLGSSKIMMGPSSELGPIDPQLTVTENAQIKRFSVWNLVEGYKELFKRAVKETGNLEPYLQQLKLYDAREIKELEGAMDLAEDIAQRSLATGMMKGKSEKEIHKKILMFLTPQQKKSHGRPIYFDEAEKCGLTIERLDPKSRIGKLVYELHVRTENFARTRVYKCVESKFHAFASAID